MRKALLLFVTAILMLTSTSVGAQQKVWDETESQKEERMKWWTNDRFGMFVHWGIYALPARHEWVQTNERIPFEEYKKYFELFDPDLYNPREWAQKAKEAGMKYAVITAKHHDGFFMFETKHTNYNVMNTPYGKDIIKEWVDAYKEAGLKVGFYYSLIDWHHPDFTIDRIHPIRPNNKADYDKMNEGKDMNKYRKYLKDQITELLTNYGTIDILWLDYSYPGELGKGRDDWDSIELLKLVRKLQPGILIDDRAD
ncbi:MAG: alpha-L-fucosidase, partial [Proteiniphilum sp.]|nr:alpha-L-fucosidase [Proteiniphilum sp.]